MTKFCVKKPFYVLVAVIIILVIGVVSLTSMQTDLMPDLSLPYLAVITTEVGASPEQVEMDITEPMEGALGTINGVENITSSSSENYGMVMLEFSEDTDMEAALVRTSMALDELELPDGCGTPNIMEISMDMVATMYAAVDYEGKDIKEVTSFAEDTVIPYLERQNGVASVSASGEVSDSVEIRLNQDKIDAVNEKILDHTNEKLADAAKELEDAKADLEKGEEELAKQKANLEKQQTDTNQQIADASVQLSQAQATKAAYESSYNSLNASKKALEAEKQAYEDAGMQDNYDQLDGMFAQYQMALGTTAEAAGITVPGGIAEAAADQEATEAFLQWLTQIGQGDAVSGITYESIKQVYEIVTTRLPQIDTALANLDTELAAAQAMLDEINKQMEGMDDQQSEVIAGGYSAAAGFGSGQAQVAAGESELTSAREQLEEAQQQIDDAREATLKNANIDALLDLQTLSSIIYAQNMAMPAGYIDDESDNQWLVEVGENFADESEIEDLVLTKISGVGKIRISDVADVTIVDNAGETYAKMNGNDAVLLSIYKVSTASTSDVAKTLTSAFSNLQEDYPGLTVTTIMNQGEYISIIIKSVLTSMLLGALLAIVVLALFLQEVKPTIVVAFSIPFSVLFALIVMYFTGIGINVMSLGGLCLGIGMLVDNSIVVMENIYRLRQKGLSAGAAAVQGAKQVAAPIIASTATTICVFFPMVYVTGMVSQLMVPFAFTISYALVASLIVALTVVPTFSSVMLKNVREKKHPIFTWIQNAYGKALEFCLRFKVVPLALAIVLLVLCVYRAFDTGLVLLDDMESNQISVSMTLPDDCEKEDAYACADEVMERILAVDGIASVGAMDGNTSAMAMSVSTGDNYTQFSFNIITDDDIKTTDEFHAICQEIEEQTADIELADISVTSSALGEMSTMLGSGIEIDIYGDDQDTLVSISQDVREMLEQVNGLENIDDGLANADSSVHLFIDRNKAASCGLTAAQILQAIAARTTNDATAITMNKDGVNLDVRLVDETEPLTYENLMDMELSVDTVNDDGETVTKTYKLSKFAEMTTGTSMDTITRENGSRYMTVTADAKDGYNATLLARSVQEKLDAYSAPEGYMVEIGGESEQVMDMVWQMLKALALGALLVYLIMVAQFQSLLSPFIILFTIPLAFTGGMIGLAAFGKSISAMSLMGFMILMGTVVNNGIVFVDYVNQLRLAGVERHQALIATGKTRMRPILMTAMTTILSMSVMVFSKDAGNAMQKGMSIVVAAGLIYATLMTLFIVPVLYDIFYRKQPKVIDVGDDLDEIPDETSDFLEQNKENIQIL
jgi:multidrug efflux pump subunit AcrB